MLSAPDGWVEMVEVNPPRLPSMTHLELARPLAHVLITDNPFKQVRVSPYAFAARITHDVPEVRPTVVCSTRDRNILAIESEVRGALANGVAVVPRRPGRHASRGRALEQQLRDRRAPAGAPGARSRRSSSRSA